MELATAIVIGVLNALFLLGGMATSGPPLLSRPGIETLVALLVVTLPFAATALSAFGRRTKAVWLVGVGTNALTVVAMLALLIFMSRGMGGGPLASGVAVAGIFSTLNIAYLIWRAPRAASSLPSQPAT